MSGAIPEADWRVFRSLHPIWIDRFCKRVNDELLRGLVVVGTPPLPLSIAIHGGGGRRQVGIL